MVVQKCTDAALLMVFNFGGRHIVSDYHKLLKMLQIFMSQNHFPFNWNANCIVQH